MTRPWVSSIIEAAQDAYYSRPKPITWKTRLWLVWQGLTFQARVFEHIEDRRSGGSMPLDERVEVRGWIHNDGRVFITHFRIY